MMLKPITLVAAGLAATQAFLLPPSLSTSDIEIANDIPKIVNSQEIYHINLPCPGCLAHYKGNKHGYSKPTKEAVERPTHLELDFSIQHGADKNDKLVIRGPGVETHELYPNPTTDRTPIRAHIAFDEPSKIEKKLRGHSGGRHRNQPLGYTMSAVSSHVNKEDGLQLIEIDFQVLEVGKRPMQLRPIRITVVRDVMNGALTIGNIEVQSKVVTEPTPSDKEEKCTNSLCEWYRMMKEKAKEMKAKCSGSKTHRPPPSHQHHGGRPYKAHHGGQSHGHHGATSEFFKSFIVHILFPVLIGVIAGFTVSFIGMAIIGSLIVAVHRVLFRKPSQRRRSCIHKAAKKEVAVAEVEEKAGLMVNQGEETEDAPPAYEDGKDVPPV